MDGQSETADGGVVVGPCMAVVGVMAAVGWTLMAVDHMRTRAARKKPGWTLSVHQLDLHGPLRSRADPYSDSCTPSMQMYS